jgi:hypothetical protein
MGLSAAYQPRQPSETALYRVVHRHLESFLDHADAHGRTVPGFVAEELRSFLTCGILSYGFARAVCGHCETERLVPFSCGGRGVCPSCMGRRMADTSARLVDQVLPRVPIRQWVLSLPHALRFVLAYEPELCTEVLGVFTREVFAWLEAAARREGDVPAGAKVHGGGVTAIQRADSAAKLNLHFHTLALDGVFVEHPGEESLQFVATPAPSHAEVSAVAWATCLGVMKLLKARGLALDADLSDLDSSASQHALLFDPMLAQCASASMLGVVLIGPRAGRQVLRLGRGPTDTDSRGRAAHGFDLHAGRRVSAHDRKGLETLCRYILRPPLSHARVTLTPEGRVRLKLKRPWSDGTSHLVFTPLDFLARLVPLIPPPRTHRVRYHGVLASHHRLRSRVVPSPPADKESTQLHLWHRRAGALAPAPKHRVKWHELLARTFGVDPLRCPQCRGTMRIIGFVTRPQSIAYHLHWRGLSPGVPVYQPRGPPQLELPFPDRVAA